MAKINQKKELGKGIRALLGDINQQMNEDDVLVLENPKNNQYTTFKFG
jgi:hypothetical protein